MGEKIKETRIICLANQKGGVSKTTASLNLSYVLANVKKYKVLLIDLDSQASASLSVGIDIANEEVNSIDELLDKKVSDEIDEYEWEDIQNYIYTPKYEGVVRNGTKWDRTELPYGFDIIPSRLNLALVELKMGVKASQNNGIINPLYLKKLTDVICEKGDYDYIVIDTPPALGSLSMNAMMASSSGGIIVPATLDLLSFYGINSFIDSANYVVDFYKKSGLEHRGILGILLSLYSSRRTVDRAVEKYVVDFYPIATFKSTIRESTDCKRANASNMLFCQINKKALADFTSLAEEVEFAIENKEQFEIEAKKRFEDVSEELNKEEKGENNG